MKRVEDVLFRHSARRLRRQNKLLQLVSEKPSQELSPYEQSRGMAVADEGSANEG